MKPDIKDFRLMQTMLEIRGLSCFLFDREYSKIENIDQGFRLQWFSEDPYGVMKKVLQNIPPHTLCCITDYFAVQYLAFRMPGNDYESAALVIGPYRQSEVDELLSAALNTFDGFSSYREMLQRYYQSAVYISEDHMLLDILVLALERLLDLPDQIGMKFLTPEEDFSEHSVSLSEEDQISMEESEQRYELEDRFLNAISEGNYQEARKAQALFNQYRAPRLRYRSSLQDEKIALLTLNSLSRKAVQRANVHPAHIDRVSREFARRVRAAGNTHTLIQLMDDMMRAYCSLVREHSLTQYSQMIRNAINYIDFNLKENLSLSHVAAEIAIDKRYLSTQFTKEVGKTLTDYINEKRILQSLPLLHKTKINIHSIAAEVGFSDYNYYTRLFGRVMGMSPREYRESIRFPEGTNKKAHI